MSLTAPNHTKPFYWEGTHIRFVPYSLSGQKTKRWTVESKDGVPLGTVAWFSHWRKYTFQPYGATIYEQTCLREVAEFIELRTKEHRTRVL